MKKIQVSGLQTVPVRKKVHHLCVIDFSGSMHYELQAMGQMLIEKIKKLPEQDKISILYFSSRNDSDYIIQDFIIDDNADKEFLSSKIRKRFESRGLTGFKEPLETTSKIQKGNYLLNVLFLTDGYDNQWNVNEILKATDLASQNADSMTIVEFGDYCNHDLLVQMVNIASKNCMTSLEYSKNREKYTEVVENTFQKEIKSANKIEISAEDNILPFIYDREYAFERDSERKKYLVPEDLSSVSYFDGNLEGATEEDLYYLAYHLAIRKSKKECIETLKKLGDEDIFNKYINAVTIQEQNNVLAELLERARNEELRYPFGKNNNLQIDENAYCIMNLLEDLGQEGNLLYTLSDRFTYNRIGKPKIQRSAMLTESEKQAIKSTQKATESKAIFDAKYELKFERNDNGLVPFNSFVFSQEEGRANISINVKQLGSVDTSVIPEAKYKLGIVKTHKYNNYTIIKDGRINTPILPFKLTQETFDKLKQKGVLANDLLYNADLIYDVNISKLPVLNLNMQKEPLFSDLLDKQYQLETLKAKKKVFDARYKELFTKVDETFVKVYGEEETKWLSEIGIGYNGFSPKMVEAEASDNYNANSFKIEFIVGARGGSFTLPSVNDIKKAVSGGKELSIPQKMMQKYITELEILEQQNSGNLETVLKSEISNVLLEKRKIEVEIMKTIFPVVAAGVWFSDIKPDVKETVYNCEYGTMNVKISFEEKTYEI